MTMTQTKLSSFCRNAFESRKLKSVSDGPDPLTLNEIMCGMEWMDL